MKKLFKPKSMAESLDAALRSINRTNLIYLLKIEENWEEIVGPKLSLISGPAGLTGGKLVLFVREPVWIDSMMYLKSTIIQKVNDFLPGEIVTNIQMVLKDDFLKKDTGEEEIAEIESIELPEEEAREAMEALLQLPDSKLRSTFKRVMLGSYRVERDRTRLK